MAITPVEFDWVTGSSPTLYLFGKQSDVVANTGGDAGSEETNRGGTFIANVAEALAGWYKAYVDDGGNKFPIGWVKLADNTDTHEVDRIGQPAESSLAKDAADTKFLVEHQRGAHTHQPVGKIFYVDPTNGDTHANGNRGGIHDPYAGVQDCHDNAVTDSNHDTIILVSGASGGATTLTEDVTISKRYLFIRGPGRDFIWTRSGAGDTITVTADGVELSGFQVNTAATGSGNGITVTSADFFKAKHLWINNTRGDAIELTDCDNFVIDHCSLQSSGQSGTGHGIQVVAGSGETGDYGTIRHCYIHDVAGDGIQLDTTGGGSVDSAMIHDNIIEGCTDDGIDLVDSGCTGVVIKNNVFGNNSGSDIEDAGTNTISVNNEQYAKHSGVIVASNGLDSVVPSDPSAIPVLGTASIVTWIGYFGAWTVNEVNVDGDSVDLRNSADDANLATHAASDDGVTFVNGAAA